MLVSIIIPARRWDDSLESTLRSIENQDVDGETHVEVIVGLADAGSAGVPSTVRVVENPSGTIPDALNLAIEEASGSVIVRVDARCHLPRDYVARVVERLSDPAIGSVGGAALVLDRGAVGSAYAIAFNSPLLGPSRYRYSAHSGPADCAYLGAWRRELLREVGGFDPRLIRNQDNELADRVRALGKVVWYDADLVVGYLNGRGLRDSVAHHYEFGFWRSMQRRQGQGGLNRRHAAALGAVAATTAGMALGVRRPRMRSSVLASGLVGYLGLAVSGYITASRLRRRRPDLPGDPFHPVGVLMAPALAVAIDAAWVAGLVRGALPGVGHDSGRPEVR